MTASLVCDFEDIEYDELYYYCEEGYTMELIILMC